MIFVMEQTITPAEIEDFLGQIWAFAQLEPDHLRILSRLVRVRESDLRAYMAEMPPIKPTIARA